MRWSVLLESTPWFQVAESPADALFLSASWGPPLVALVVLGLLAGGAYLVRRGRKRRDEEGPMLIFPLHGGEAARPSAARRPATLAGSEAGVTMAEPAPPEVPARRMDPRRGTDSMPPESSAPESSTPDPAERLVLPTPSAAQSRGEVPPPREGGAVQYQRPPDGTLQLLPGRLAVISGSEAGEEIRFVRVPGAPAEITFGRNEGPAYRHVQLHSPTVSRQHARMAFLDGGWTLRNESSTNPTRLNGRPLSSAVEEILLADGDLIEMGDIIFRFHFQATADRLPARSSWYTDLGRRPTNQDAVLIKSLSGGRELAAVCDGMGSHHAGGLASRQALEGLVAALLDDDDLAAAVERANEKVLEAAKEDPEREGMGTTLVASLRQGRSYWIANVGDSRAYRVDASGIRRLTNDHSFVAEATRDGRMSEEEAARSPWRNAVTRNLGAAEQVEVDIFGPFDAMEPHRILLCTDGIHGVLTDPEIEAVVRETPDIRDLARALSERALVRGGEDNVAVAALGFGGPGSDGFEPGRTP
jgi:PPM family protein phosphatase